MSINSIARAALKALSSSSSSSSATSDDDEDYAIDNNIDCDYNFDEDNDNDNKNNDDDSPIILDDCSPINKAELAKIGPAVASDKTNEGNRSKKNNSNNNDKYPLAHLKPFFDVGTPVYGPWWPAHVKERKECDEWFSGTISSYKEVHSPNNPSPYGPLRLYSIQFDDGDAIKDVHDYYVFSKEDYELQVIKPAWKGVQNKFDANYDTDMWARLIGWYEVTINGSNIQFASLSGQQAG